MRQIWKMITASALLIMFAIVLGTVFMIAVYTVPIDRAEYHLLESMELIGRDENGKENWAFPEISSNLDSFTDSIMLNNAIYRPFQSVVENAMLNPRVEYESTEMTMNLVRFINHDEGGHAVEYSRYWHGYLLLLIPMLSFFSLGEIRIILMIIQLFLLVEILMELIQKVGKMAVGMFLLSVLLINPISSALCLQYATIYQLMLISTLFVLKREDWLNKGKLTYFFIIIGACCAFFDFLTYPLITLCIPLATFLVLKERKWVLGRKDSLESFILKGNGERDASRALCRDRVRESVSIVLKSSLGWGAGYVGMWTGKWVVASLLTGKNIIQNGISAVQIRTWGDGIAEGVEDTTFITTVERNLKIFQQPLVLLILAIVAVFIVTLVVKKKFYSPMVGNVIPFILLASFPFLWILIIRQHSAIHSFMVYKIFASTIWALSCIPICLKKKPKDN